MRCMLLLALVGCAAERPVGDADAGWDTLRYGDFVGAGFPAEVMLGLFDNGTPTNALQREGDAALLPPAFNLFEAPEGVQVVGGVTCFGCHSSRINGQFIPGLGNSFNDTTTAVSDAEQYDLIGDAVTREFGAGSPEDLATQRLIRGAQAVSPSMQTPFRGVNPAFAIEWAAARHREPDTLEWTDSPRFDAATVPASDVPPWWNVKKKARLYYNGVGQGDFARLMTQISIVAVRDSEHMDSIDAQFADVRAFIESLEPPPYPGEIDAPLAATGEAEFLERCARCHGTYGPEGAYPNELVLLDEIGTDPTYARVFLDDPTFVDFLNASWWAQGPYKATFEPFEGYIAPPLDGVWATAPYLHNGSVPDLVTLLDSTARPTTWWRDFESSTYDLVLVGWPWQARDAGPPDVYDTTLQGYGNDGHTYGDSLSTQERLAVVEYLKTL